MICIFSEVTVVTDLFGGVCVSAFVVIGGYRASVFCSLTREYKNAEVTIAASAFCSCRILL